MSHPISLSPDAVTQIHTLLKENDMEGHALRLAIRGGGCSGYSYQLEFVEEADQDAVEEHGPDAEFTQDGVRILLGAFKRDYLAGTVIDFQDTLMEAGFKILNPNAKRACGCGESFDIDEGEAVGASAY